MNELISPQRAIHLIQDHLACLPTERLQRSLLSGRVLANPIIADRDYPPYDRVTMDGVALQFQEGRCEYNISHTVEAGQPVVQASLSEVAYRINTGGVLPQGCDTVVPVEELTFRDDQVILQSPDTVERGQFIHRKGADTQRGVEVLLKGTIIDSSVMLLLASLGVAEASVYKAPRVALLTTGAEVIAPEETPLPHQIRQSHQTMLSTALATLGVTHLIHEHVADSREGFQEFFDTHLAEVDLIITCGAISKGTTDYLREVISSFAGDPVFHGIAQRPGKPMAFWAAPLPIFSLPGNALSALVCFHQYVQPAIRQMMGRGKREKRKVQVLGDIPTHRFALHIPARLEGAMHVRLLPTGNSGDFVSMVGSQGYVTLLPEHQEGDLVEFVSWL